MITQQLSPTSTEDSHHTNYILKISPHLQAGYENTAYLKCKTCTNIGENLFSRCIGNMFKPVIGQAKTSENSNFILLGQAKVISNHTQKLLPFNAG